MIEPPDRRDRLDDELARRFAHLREAEGRLAPAFPELRPAPVAAGHGRSVRVAAAVAIAAALLFVALPRPPSPGDLYLEVMGESELLTDDLLIVSPLALPEGSDPPSLFDPGPFAPATWEEGVIHDA